MALSRDLYKKLKRMSREELEEYLKNLYSEGVTLGFREGNAVMKDLFIESIKTTSGIGEKRMASVLNKVNSTVLARVEGLPS